MTPIGANFLLRILLTCHSKDIEIISLHDWGKFSPFFNKEKVWTHIELFRKALKKIWVAPWQTVHHQYSGIFLRANPTSKLLAETLTGFTSVQ